MAAEWTGRAHAMVVDIAATWEDYHLVRRAIGEASPAGLLLHAAGATDDGFRLIDVWESEDAWPAYHRLLMRAFDDLSVTPSVRLLRVGHLITSPRTSEERNSG